MNLKLNFALVYSSTNNFYFSPEIKLTTPTNYKYPTYLAFSYNWEIPYENELGFNLPTYYILEKRGEELLRQQRRIKLELGITALNTHSLTVTPSISLNSDPLARNYYYKSFYRDEFMPSDLFLFGDIGYSDQFQIKIDMIYQFSQKMKISSKFGYSYYDDNPDKNYSENNQNWKPKEEILKDKLNGYLPSFFGELFFNYQMTKELQFSLFLNYESSKKTYFLFPYRENSFIIRNERNKDILDADFEIRYSIQTLGDIFILGKNILNRKQYYSYPILKPDIRLAAGFEYFF